MALHVGLFADAHTERAAHIGEVTADGPPVVLETAFGGERLLDELEDDPLPRIC